MGTHCTDTAPSKGDGPLGVQLFGVAGMELMGTQHLGMELTLPGTHGDTALGHSTWTALGKGEDDPLLGKGNGT